MPTTAAAKFMNQLVQIIEKQDLRISHLQSEIDKLKAWSDLNDHYLEEMVESQGSALDRLYTVIQEIHDGNVIEERLEELEKEDAMPIAQLVKEFAEKNLTPEVAKELEIRK